MANRDALRAFQSRLASRLQAARTTGVAASWLAVEAGEGKYLFPLGHAGEIFPWTPPQPVPYTQPWFLGVANLRGGLYGVVHLSAFASGAPDNTAATEAARMQSRLVALNELLEVNCALLVDRLAGLRGAEAFTASEPPDAQAPAWLGHLYTDAAGERWQEVNLQALSQQPEFLSIGA
ncbi:chemotaxis protein CheW [Variovorax beijingensis]|jgi:twitching motility protein PilI|uniref:Chemotaxis protein CheW n=1 Tax=Variovorax beijingensis TaxID=2496117 RepID=A0A3P3EPU9_9BURK|nr:MULTISPECIES: chemotaxis protein CheW [Variovorax]RRH88419.1 chemotaxis protein CheW [Variovorax beijingensis]RSZ38648.1 chemotaxis protein CheW [Variovorax beijingensis]WPH13366.1 chemotaxis protein CheW [Variovorax paradoxus]WPH19886.1 chemotaxis protein CheW [Variovorax paradoxus]